VVTTSTSTVVSCSGDVKRPPQNQDWKAVSTQSELGGGDGGEALGSLRFSAASTENNMK
jgi:hypothetical protein